LRTVFVGFKIQFVDDYSIQGYTFWAGLYSVMSFDVQCSRIHILRFFFRLKNIDFLRFLLNDVSKSRTKSANV